MAKRKASDALQKTKVKEPPKNDIRDVLGLRKPSEIWLKTRYMNADQLEQYLTDEITKLVKTFDMSIRHTKHQWRELAQSILGKNVDLDKVADSLSHQFSNKFAPVYSDAIEAVMKVSTKGEPESKSANEFNRIMSVMSNWTVKDELIELKDNWQQAENENADAIRATSELPEEAVGDNVEEEPLPTKEKTKGIRASIWFGDKNKKRLKTIASALLLASAGAASATPSKYLRSIGRGLLATKAIMKASGDTWSNVLGDAASKTVSGRRGVRRKGFFSSLWKATKQTNTAAKKIQPLSLPSSKTDFTPREETIEKSRLDAANSDELKEQTELLKQIEKNTRGDTNDSLSKSTFKEKALSMLGMGTGSALGGGGLAAALGLARVVPLVAASAAAGLAVNEAWTAIKDGILGNGTGENAISKALEALGKSLGKNIYHSVNPTESKSEKDSRAEHNTAADIRTSLKEISSGRDSNGYLNLKRTVEERRNAGTWNESSPASQEILRAISDFETARSKDSKSIESLSDSQKLLLGEAAASAQQHGNELSPQMREALRYSSQFSPEERAFRKELETGDAQKHEKESKEKKENIESDAQWKLKQKFIEQGIWNPESNRSHRAIEEELQRRHADQNERASGVPKSSSAAWLAKSRQMGDSLFSVAVKQRREVGEPVSVVGERPVVVQNTQNNSVQHNTTLATPTSPRNSESSWDRSIGLSYAR